MDNTIRRIAIRTDDGLALRAEVTPGDSTQSCGLVICHPHPLHGGNMFNPVVTALMQAAVSLGMPALRFNFRGTNGSEGNYQDGVGEQRDVIAAVNWLGGHDVGNPHETTEGRTIVLAGYSFGADVALQVDHPAVAGWLAVAPPLTMTPDSSTPPSVDSGLPAGADQRPTLVIAGTNDQFRSADAAGEKVRTWGTTEVKALAGADHFLATELNTIQKVAADFLSRIQANPPQGL